MFQHEAVASFESPAGATAATARLIEVGYDEHEVAIEPHGYEVMTEPGIGSRMAARSRTGAAFGAAASAVATTAVLLGLGDIGIVLAALGLGGVIGALIGAVVGVANHLRAHSFSEREGRHRLRPERFDVVVTRDPVAANHALARWWDPAAPRARRRAPA